MPPMLGFLCRTGFVPTTAFCTPRAGRFDVGALDARHGRVLARRYVPEVREDALVVWDPITDKQRVLPIPPRPTISSTAAVLCAGAGVCHHLDCHRGPFLVVFAGGGCLVARQRLPRHNYGCHGNLAGVWFVNQLWQPRDSLAHYFVKFRHTCGGCFLRLKFGDATTLVAGVGRRPNSPDTSEMFVCTYSSDVDAWSEPISTQHLDDIFEDLEERTVLVGNAIYFGILSTNITLKYNLESHEMSWIQLPYECNYWGRHVLTTTEEGVLGLVTIFDSKLSMWLRKGPPEVDAGWTMIRVIDLKTLLPLDGVFTSPHVVGFADDPGILFMMVESVLDTIDLKTRKVELYQGKGDLCIVPYMSFYTPELEVACTGEEPSAGGSNA